MQNRSPEQPQDRRSIWSVPRHLWVLYVVLFALQYFIFLGLNIWNEIASRGDSGTVPVILNVQKEMTASILNMAASTYLILEGVMLAQWLRERDQRKRQERIKQVQNETHQRWQAWYERMQAAQREGLPFDEPPPGQKNEGAED